MSDELQKSQGSGLSSTGARKAVDLGRKMGDIASKLAGSAAIELPRMFHQLVVFVLDGSGSMTVPGLSGRSKGKEVHEAVKAVMERLQRSKNKNCFDVSCRVYSIDDKVILSQRLVTTVSTAGQSFDPTGHIEAKDTYVVPALEAARDEAVAYLKANAGKRAQALIILLSDGALHDEEDALELAEEIKTMGGVALSTIFYGTDPRILRMKGADEHFNEQCAEVLKEMATSDAFHTSTLDPEEVRKHMIRSISSVSGPIED
jgi:hypothetical protein